MILRRLVGLRLSLGMGLAFLSAVACATAPPHERVIPDRAMDVAHVPATLTDSALFRNPDALYHAAMLHAAADRPAFDPDRAATLLAAFVERFPNDPRVRDASDRLALVNEVQSLRAELRALKAIDLARPPR